MKLGRALFLLLLAGKIHALDISKYQFKNQEGKTESLVHLKNQYIFISFIFTRCPMPKMCPLTVNLTKRLAQEWKRSKPHIPVHFVLATLDPEFDTPAVLKNFAVQNQLTRGFSFWTGPKKDLIAFASEFNVVGFPSKGALSHNMKSILLAPGLKQLSQYKDNEWTPSEVLSKLPL